VRAYCSRLMQSDEGSGTMACVMLIALAAALIATVASVGGALLCRCHGIVGGVGVLVWWRIRSVCRRVACRGRE
jgi:hypothetical protein